MEIEIRDALFRTIPFLLILIGLSIALKRKRITAGELHIRKPVSYKAVAWWVTAFLIYVLVFELTLFQLGLLRINQWEYGFMPSLIRIAGIVVLAPIAEELVFRGLILHKLRQLKVPKHLAIILQAILFVALHSVYNFTLSSQIAMLQLFSDAVIFAYAMYNTRSIYTPVLLHALGNSVAVLEQFLL